MKTNIYRLSYVDQLAAPDFDSGAVENFGLIIYREMLMLYRPGSSSAEEKKETGLVVAHELSHELSHQVKSPLARMDNNLETNLIVMWGFVVVWKHLDL